MEVNWKDRIGGIFYNKLDTKAIKYDTEESLSYATPFVQSKAMTNQCIYMLKGMTNITMVETCGGLGSDTMQFLTCKNISRIITTELNPLRYDAMTSNITIMKEAIKSSTPVEAINGNFIEYFYKNRDYLNKQKNIVSYIDFPWGENYFEDKNINENMTLNMFHPDNKLEKYNTSEIFDLVSGLNNVRMVIFKVPINHTLVESKFISYTTIVKKHAKYIFIIL